MALAREAGVDPASLAEDLARHKSTNDVAKEIQREHGAEKPAAAAPGETLPVLSQTWWLEPMFWVPNPFASGRPGEANAWGVPPWVLAAVAAGIWWTQRGRDGRS